MAKKTIDAHPVRGFAAIAPGWTTTMNQIIAAVTVIHRSRAGMTAALANDDLSLLATNPAPVMRAIEAISWFAAPKEAQMIKNLPLQPSQIPIAAGITEAIQRLVMKL